MDTSEVPEKVQREFDESLDADIEKWETAILKSIQHYEQSEEPIR